MWRLPWESPKPFLWRRSTYSPTSRRAGNATLKEAGDAASTITPAIICTQRSTRAGNVGAYTSVAGECESCGRSVTMAGRPARQSMYHCPVQLPNAARYPLASAYSYTVRALNKMRRFMSVAREMCTASPFLADKS